VATIIHGALYSTINSFDELAAIPIYAICLTLGIYVTIKMRQRKKLYEQLFGSPTNPHAPEELYGDEEHEES